MSTKPITTPRYAVAVTLPGREPELWTFRPDDVPYFGTRQQAEATVGSVRHLLALDHPDAVVEAVPVAVTVAAREQEKH
jgi:hypothetical protein